jgi:phenol 2-monooxygenase
MKVNNGLLVERAVEPLSLSLDETSIDSLDAYPVTVVVQHLPQETVSENGSTTAGGPESGLYRSNLFADDAGDAIPQQRQQAGQNETIKSKYVVGCDGARSWTRKQINCELEGENSSTYWGVMDAHVVTDFPVWINPLLHRQSNYMLLRTFASKLLSIRHRAGPFSLYQENGTSFDFISRWAP